MTFHVAQGFITSMKEQVGKVLGGGPVRSPGLRAHRLWLESELHAASAGQGRSGDCCGEAQRGTRGRCAH